MGDPAVYFLRLCFEFWMRQWTMQPSIPSGPRRAWLVLLRKLQQASPQHRSRHVRGPMGAIM
eukprot:7332460-Pyramimonas_sp.AAC.1